MHGGFINLRSALPMNLKARHTNFKIFNGAQGDIDRIVSIFDECIGAYDGPYLFGERPSLVAMRHQLTIYPGGYIV